jgi:hypothetical protein
MSKRNTASSEGLKWIVIGIIVIAIILLSIR